MKLSTMLLRFYAALSIACVGCGASGASVKRGACHVVRTMCTAVDAVCASSGEESASADPNDD